MAARETDTSLSARERNRRSVRDVIMGRLGGRSSLPEPQRVRPGVPIGRTQRARKRARMTSKEARPFRWEEKGSQGHRAYPTAILLGGGPKGILPLETAHQG